MPDTTFAELAARAALSGRALQEDLRGRLIEMAEHPDAEARVARVQARTTATRGRLTRDEILALRDEDRR